MQSPFSFRRFAPAFDYLGSPFSAFFRPLLLGFRSTLSRFPTSFFRSTFTFFRQLLSRFRLLSVLFFLSAFFPVLLTAAPRRSLSSFVPRVFPLPSRLGFPSVPSGSAYLAFLYCFLSSFPVSLPQPFHRCSSYPLPFGFLSDVCSCLPFSFDPFRFRV